MNNPQLAIYLLNAGGGGAERAAVKLANEAAVMGFAVDLVLGEPTGILLGRVSEKVRVIDLLGYGITLKRNELQDNSSCINVYKRDYFFHIVRLISYIRKNKPKVIMSFMDLANIQLILAARIVGFEGGVVIGQRASILPVYSQIGWLRRSAYILAIRYCYPLATAIISNSYAATNEIKELTNAQSENIHTIHNSVDIESNNILSLEALEDRWVSNISVPIIISVGSLSKIKDRVTLVKAFQIVRQRRNARLIILGEGADRKAIEGLILQLGLRQDVYLPGFDINPYRWMNKASLLVSSSVTEGCPNHILEALSLNIPIVATDCPGDTAELLGRGRWGDLVPVGDERKMASAILRSLEFNGPHNGVVRAKDFTPANIAKSYMHVLMSCYSCAT